MDKTFKKNFLKGSAAASIGTISSMGFHFLSITVLARVLSVTDFGIYSLIIAVVFVFNTLGSFGLEVTLVKFISSSDPEERDYIFVPIFILKILTTSIIAILFYFTGTLILPLFGEGLVKFGFYISVLFFMGSFRDIFFNLFQGLKYFKKYALVQVSSAAIRVIFIVVFVLLKSLTLNSLILIEIYTTALAIIIQLVNVPYKKVLRPIKDKQIFNSIIKFSLPVYFNNIFDILNARLNLFIIGLYLTPASVAYYDVANKIPTALRKIYASFLIVFFPNLSDLFSNDKKSSGEDLINKSLNIISLLLSFGALISFLFKDEIVVLLYSSKYSESAFAFFLLMFNFLIRSLSVSWVIQIWLLGIPKFQ